MSFFTFLKKVFSWLSLCYGLLNRVNTDTLLSVYIFIRSQLSLETVEDEYMVLVSRRIQEYIIRHFRLHCEQSKKSLLLYSALALMTFVFLTWNLSLVVQQIQLYVGYNAGSRGGILQGKN